MKPRRLPFTYVVVSLGLYAASVAAAPLAAPATPSVVPAAQSSPLQPLGGTLFFTEAERRAMDKARTDQSQSTADGPPGAKAPGLISGVVKRSDGKGTVWVDGAPVAGGAGQATTSKMVGKPLHMVTEITAPTSPKRAAKPSL